MVLPGRGARTNLTAVTIALLALVVVAVAAIGAALRLFLLWRRAQAEAAAAIALQREQRRHTRPPIRVRIGVHTGPAVHRDGDLFGRNVAYAARVAACAAGDEILISETARAALTAEGLTVGDGLEV